MPFRNKQVRERRRHSVCPSERFLKSNNAAALLISPDKACLTCRFAESLEELAQSKLKNTDTTIVTDDNQKQKFKQRPRTITSDNSALINNKLKPFSSFSREGFKNF